jgi:hypothetical protein
MTATESRKITGASVEHLAQSGLVLKARDIAVNLGLTEAIPTERGFECFYSANHRKEELCVTLTMWRQSPTYRFPLERIAIRLATQRKERTVLLAQHGGDPSEARIVYEYLTKGSCARAKEYSIVTYEPGTWEREIEKLWKIATAPIAAPQHRRSYRSRCGPL